MRSNLARVALTIGLILGMASSVASRETVTYGYDPIGRVISVTRSDGNVITYSYDTAGNRTQVGVGGPPTANADAVSTPKNVTLTFNPRTNDTDPNGDTLTITAVGTPSHGAATIVSAGAEIQYVPTTNYAGPDSFSYTISDGNGNIASATISVVVQGPPVPVTDTISTALNTAKTVNPLANDTDPNGDSLSVTAKTNGAHGTVTIDSATSLTYTPATGYTGGDTFTYTVSDGQGGTAVGTVNVTVTTANQAPDAVNDTKVAQKNTTLNFDPRTNDTDPESNSLTITSVSTPLHGSISIISSGTQLSYSPTTGYVGADSFTYTISDGMGGSDTATVSVSVNGPPVATNDSQTTALNTPVTFNPLTNDTDPDSDTLTVTGKTNGANGTVTFTSTSLTFTPTTGFNGVATFTYTISDGRGGPAEGTVSVTVGTAVADGTVLVTQSTQGSFSFTIPAGVTFIDIEGWGGGGDAWYNELGELGGFEVPGSGGGYFKKHISVTPGQVITGYVSSNGDATPTSIAAPALAAAAGLQEGEGSWATGGDVNTPGRAGGQGNWWNGGGAGNGGGDQTTFGASGTSPGGGGAARMGGGAPGRIKITARTS
jgi:YD repeat-containing protein